MYKKYKEEVHSRGTMHMLVYNAKLYKILQYCVSLCKKRVEEVHCKCGGMELEAWGLQSAQEVCKKCAKELHCKCWDVEQDRTR